MSEAIDQHGSQVDAQDPFHEMWHVPFCKGSDPAFVECFIVALEHYKLLKGMVLFRESDDFLMVLIEGAVEVHDGVGGPRVIVASPLAVCGFDRTRATRAAAQSVCKVQRLSQRRLVQLAADFPEDTRRVLLRIMTFQVRAENVLRLPWWSPAAAFQGLAPFAECSEAFAATVGKIMRLEVYLPGETIVEEGAIVDSTLILESGRCHIEKRSSKSLWNIDVVDEITDGFWIGGMGGVCGFAGELKRKATVRAIAVCKVHRLPTAALVEVLGCSPPERQRFRAIAERDLRAKDTERLEDHDFFKGFTRTFLNLLRPKCRVQVFFAKETLIRQGDPADSLFIFGSESGVVLEIDGQRVKEIHGRHCLGVLALLCHRPKRRAATVITLTACAVRVLRREDWLDALKLYPEHREWIDSFTQEQAEKVSEAREGLLRRRAWERIQARDSTAKQKFWLRRARSGFGPRPERGPAAAQRLPTACLEPSHQEAARTMPMLAVPLAVLGAASKRGSAVAAGGKAAARPSFCRERWPCFNGAEALLPQTRLPCLGGPAPAEAAAEEQLQADGCEDDMLRLAREWRAAAMLEQHDLP